MRIQRQIAHRHPLETTHLQPALLAFGLDASTVWLTLAGLALVWFALIAHVVRVERAAAKARKAEEAAEAEAEATIGS